MNHVSPKRWSLRAAAMGVVGALGASALGLALPTQAFAADNTNIVVTADGPLVKSDANGNESTGAITVGDVAKLKFTWDASKANPQPGESFSIGLPNEFINRVSPLKTDLSFNDEKLGECDLTQRKIVCTFNDAIMGKNDLKGNGTALVAAQAETTGNTVNLQLNGKETPIQLPGNAPIGAKPGPKYVPAGFKKVTTPFGPTHKNISWEISFDPNTVLNKLGDSADGSTVKTFVIDEHLQPGMRFDEDLKKFVLMKGNNTVDPGATKVKLTDGSGADASTAFGDFNLEVVKLNNRKATLTVSGPFDPNSNYHIYIPSVPETADTVIQHGVRYTNVAAVANTDLRAEFTRFYTDSFTVTISYKNGFGGFNVTKLLSGDGVTSVPAGSTFKVKAAWELPEGKTPANYTDWTAPAENPLPVDVVLGKKNEIRQDFPVGTKITLTEDLAAAANLATGVTWGDPNFTVDRKTTPQTTSFVIKEKTSTPVELENVVNAVKGKFSVAKTVTGDDAAAYAEHDFVFNYSCVAGDSGKLTVKGNGTPVESPAIKAGDTCTVTEDAASAERAGYTLAPVAAQDVAIVADTVKPLSFENAYKLKQGKFSVTKTVTGDDAAAYAEHDFVFDYTCESGVNGKLTVKGNGTAVESKSVKAGDKCTVTEDATSAERAGYTLAAVAPQEVTVVADTVTNVAFDNAYTRDKGGFSVTKTVAGDKAVAPQDYTFVYDCGAGEKEITVAAGKTETVADLPVGKCSVWEKAAGVANADWSVAYTVGGKAVTGDKAEVSVVKGETVKVEATNTYKQHKGGFSVTKTVAGDKAVAPQDYTFVYDCGAGEKEITVAAGKTETVADLPVGKCSVWEKAAGVANADWSVAYTVGGKAVTGDKAEVSVVKGETVKVEATNTYKQHTGAVSITKTAQIVDGAAITDREYTFNYVCEDAFTKKKLEGTVKVLSDGKPVTVKDQLSIGSKCELSEDVASAQLEGHNLEAPKPQTATVAENGKTVQLDFTNKYTAKPSPVVPVEPAEPAKPADKQPVTPKLAQTGANTEPLIWATVLMLGGAAMAFAARRHVGRKH